GFFGRERLAASNSIGDARLDIAVKHALVERPLIAKSIVEACASEASPVDQVSNSCRFKAAAPKTIHCRAKHSVFVKLPRPSHLTSDLSLRLCDSAMLYAVLHFRMTALKLK